MQATLWCATAILLTGHWVRGQKTEPDLGSEDHVFTGSDHYDFAIVVPGSGTECFWHFAHRSGNMYLNYMGQWVTGISVNLHLLVTVNSPDGTLVTSIDDAIGQINFQTEMTGFYKMCLGNYQFGSMRVFLNFGVDYEGFEEAQRGVEEEQKVLNSTLSNIEESGYKIQTDIFHMWRYYNYGRMRRGADQYHLLSNFSYVTWWSTAQCVVIIMTGYLQLFFLKRLFYTDPQRPRC